MQNYVSLLDLSQLEQQSLEASDSGKSNTNKMNTHNLDSKGNFYFQIQRGWWGQVLNMTCPQGPNMHFWKKTKTHV